jgi:KDO2-lipid IV(A) lauroyltransferase
LRHRLGPPLIRVALRQLARLSLPSIHRLATAAGWVSAALPSRLKDTAQTNLSWCFPAMTAGERRQLLRGTLIETAKTFAETGALWFWDTDRVLALVREVSGEQLVRQALARGQGVILAAPHLGAWELAGLYCSSRFPLTSLYRPPRIAGLDVLMREHRERMGARLVPTTAHGIRALYRALQRAEAIGILPDQDPGREGGVFAPFFGIATHTMTLVSRLAHKSGAAVLIVYAERLGGGAGYHLHFHTAPAGIADSDPMRAAAALNQGIEQCVRTIPQQYLWTYKRFKTRPNRRDRFYS